ncbi:MAG TPA: hypothetical protein V6D17_10775 [Candidatus Obscuribacterales bacterium]
MSKYNTREVEPIVTGSLIAAESALDDARKTAFGPPDIKVTDTTWWAGKQQAADIDRNGDGKADARAAITYTGFGNIDKIQVTDLQKGTMDYTVQVNRDFLGMALSMSLDLDNDGRVDQTFRPVRGWFSNKVGAVSIDRDNDQDIDDTIKFKRAFFGGKVYSARVDKGKDGKVEQTFNLKRHWWTDNISEVKPTP